MSYPLKNLAKRKSSTTHSKNSKILGTNIKNLQYIQYSTLPNCSLHNLISRLMNTNSQNWNQH